MLDFIKALNFNSVVNIDHLLKATHLFYDNFIMMAIRNPSSELVEQYKNSFLPVLSFMLDSPMKPLTIKYFFSLVSSLLHKLITYPSIFKVLHQLLARSIGAIPDNDRPKSLVELIQKSRAFESDSTVFGKVTTKMIRDTLKLPDMDPVYHSLPCENAYNLVERMKEDEFDRSYAPATTAVLCDMACELIKVCYQSKLFNVGGPALSAPDSLDNIKFLANFYLKNLSFAESILPEARAAKLKKVMTVCNNLWAQKNSEFIQKSTQLLPLLFAAYEQMKKEGTLPPPIAVDGKVATVGEADKKATAS